MVSFLHIADKNDESRIVRIGIRAVKRPNLPSSVYAVPVVPDFHITHQWARELKRSGVRTLVCVQFRLPNQQQVWLGKYNCEKVAMTAAEDYPEAKGNPPFCHCRYCNRGEIRASRLVRDDA